MTATREVQTMTPEIILDTPRTESYAPRPLTEITPETPATFLMLTDNPDIYVLIVDPPRTTSIEASELSTGGSLLGDDPQITSRQLSPDNIDLQKIEEMIRHGLTENQDMEDTQNQYRKQRSQVIQQILEDNPGLSEKLAIEGIQPNDVTEILIETTAYYV